MSSSAFKNLLVVTLLANGLFFALPSAAEYTTKQEAAEANSITVTMGSGKHAGTVIAMGCSGCPLELDVDSKTRFYFRNKQIGAHEIGAHSGKAGTAIYTKDTLRAVKVRW